jgi:hypothetical protein
MPETSVPFARSGRHSHSPLTAYPSPLLAHRFSLTASRFTAFGAGAAPCASFTYSVASYPPFNLTLPGSTRLGDLASSLRDGLAGRYAIERELGREGMTRVCLARDPRPDQPVYPLRNPRFQKLVESLA